MSDTNNQDPLEEFFQKKSKDYNISYSEEDWKSLEGRLDALDAQYAARRRRRLAAAAVLIIFSLLSYFIFQNYREINSLNEQLSRQQQQENTVAPPDTLAENKTSEETRPNLADMTDPEQRNSDAGKSGEKSIANNGELQDQNLASAEQTGQITTGFQTVSHNLTVTELGCEDCKLSQTVLPADNEPNPSAYQAHSITMANESSVPSLMDEQNQSESAAHSPADSEFSKFSVGLVLGPDMSTAGDFSNFYNPGSKIGFTVNYNFNRDWAFSIGAIRSKVNYKAGSQEYDAPSAYWYDGIEADQTKAQCVLIDIPINVSYRFLQRNQSRLYASAGLSTYIMLNEDYRFSYENEQPGFPQRWNEQTGTTHFMSNANISIGYEYDITQTVSLRAEPFLRMPIREIGWGNVDLYSVGTLFSMNYNL